MKVWWLLGLGFVVLVLVLFRFGSWALIERQIAKAFDVPDLSREEAAFLIGTDKAIVFDTRARAEFEVSRLKDALWLDPDTSVDSFIADHGEVLRDKTIVFYCSVGYRSSMLVERLRDAVDTNGAVALYNLEGGIFRWYNEQRPVFDEQGETDAIHGYNWFWGNMLLKHR